MSGWAFRSVGTVGTSFNANVTPGQPAGILLNDLLIIVTMELLGSAARPVVPGWTDITLGVNWTTGAAIYIALAAGNDPMPSIPSWGNQFQNAVCLAYSGGPTTLAGLVDAASADRGYNSTSTLLWNSSGVPSNDNSLILAISCKNTLGNASPVFTETGGLIGYNRRVTQWPSNNRPTIVVDDIVQGTAALVSTPGMNMNFTEASAQPGRSSLFVFNPAIPASTPPGDNEMPGKLLGAARPSSLHEFWQVPIEIRQVPAAQIPPNDLEMPAFLLRPKSNVNLGIEQGMPRTLIGRDRVLTPVDWGYEWDAPQLLPALRSIERGFNALDLFQVTNYPPYLEFNWTVPPGARQWHRGYDAAPNLNLRGKDAMPLGSLHNVPWDPPRGPRQPVANLSFEQSGLALSNTVQPKPPLCGEWPLPLRARQPVQDFVQGTPPVMLASLTIFPAFAGSQELPPRRPARAVSLYSPEQAEYALLYSRIILPFGITSDQQNVRSIPNPNLYSISERSVFLESTGPTPPTPPPGPLGVRHVGRIIIEPIKIGEAPLIPFDFISGMESPSEVLVSAVSTCTLYSGVDPTPQFVIDGPATVMGTIALQKCLPTIVGNIYDLKCTGITNSGQILVLDTYLAIVPALP